MLLSTYTYISFTKHRTEFQLNRSNRRGGINYYVKNRIWLAGKQIIPRPMQVVTAQQTDLCYVTQLTMGHTSCVGSVNTGHALYSSGLAYTMVYSLLAYFRYISN